MVDYQLVTENIASTPNPSLRVVEGLCPSWNFIVVLMAVLFVVLNKQFYRLRLHMMLSMLTQSADNEKMMREWNPLASFTGFTMFVSYVAMLALIVQKTVVAYSGNTVLYDNFGFYLDLCCFIADFCIIRYLAASLYGWLFDVANATAHQEVLRLSSMTVLNVVMIVASLVVIFYPTKLILSITIAIILIIMIVRIIKTFSEFQILSKMNLFNIFLYFCTLEIAPVSVAIAMVCRLVATDCVL